MHQTVGIMGQLQSFKVSLSPQRATRSPTKKSSPFPGKAAEMLLKAALTMVGTDICCFLSLTTHLGLSR